MAVGLGRPPVGRDGQTRKENGRSNRRAEHRRAAASEPQRPFCTGPNLNLKEPITPCVTVVHAALKYYYSLAKELSLSNQQGRRWRRTFMSNRAT